MSYRRRQYEAEYRNSLSTGMLVSAAVHLGFALLGGLLLARSPALQRPITVGYRGPEQILHELEILEPHSVQSYFSQRQREGQKAQPEYQVRSEIVEEPGPQPLLVREEKRTERKEEPALSVEDVEFLEPVVPLHQEISFSQDFVILKAVKPDYPEYEATREIEGYVVVGCYVTAEGGIPAEQVLVVESAAYPRGESPRAFELAALDAVKQWQVLPPKRHGKVEGDWLTIRITFDLKGVEIGTGAR